MTAGLIGLIVAVAIATQGGDVAAPVLGAVILGLAAAAFAGIGLAVGGMVRSSLAAPAAALAVIVTFVLDTLGEALDLPDAILQLSLYQHLGQPMAGTYDPVGIVGAATLAVGGLLVGAWGLQRRDVGEERPGWTPSSSAWSRSVPSSTSPGTSGTRPLATRFVRRPSAGLRRRSGSS